MTPEEKTVVKVLIAVAWADGEMQAPEAGVIEGLLSGFAASDAEEKDLLDYAKSPRTLRDVPLGNLSKDDRETLMRNAALLVHSDDMETETENDILRHLASLLEMDAKETKEIVMSVRAGIQHLNRGDK